MKHTIEIEGLPEGWEPIAVAVPGEGEKIWTSKGVVSTVSAIHQEPALIVRRKVRKYDWSKTSEDVVFALNDRLYVLGRCDLDPRHGGSLPIGIWQPHLGESSPVDPDSSVVWVKTSAGEERLVLARDVDWSSQTYETAFGRKPRQIVMWKFERLSNGVEW